ncbi:MAG: hypothetical protein FD167_3382 [bacterium]|nr:MAG: hypothetical protein FD167_3382 [bacterium]
MKRLMNIHFYRIVTIALLLLGLYLPQQPTITQGNTRSAYNPAPVPSLISPEEEAIAITQKDWERLYVRCQDSCYSKTRGIGLFIQYKGISYTLRRVDNLTEADQLNDITWKGWVDISWRLRRQYTPNVGWGDWVPGANRGLRLEKKKGKWNFHPFNDSFLTKITCADIPK